MAIVWSEGFRKRYFQDPPLEVPENEDPGGFWKGYWRNSMAEEDRLYRLRNVKVKTSEIPVQPKIYSGVTDEVLDKAKKELVKLSKGWSKTSGVTLGRAWDLNGNTIAGQAYTQCHAWVSQTFRRGSQNFLTLTCHSKKRSLDICSVEAHEAIILWLASDECPLSKFILNRDDKDSLLNGGLVILCGRDGATDAQTLWLCKVLRYAIEGGRSLDAWLYLYQGGVKPLLALLVATYSRTLRGATFGYTGPDSHSSVFNVPYGEPDYSNPSQLLKPELNPSATQTRGVFLSPSTMTYPTVHTIKSFYEAEPLSDGWGGKIDGSAADREIFLAKVLKWQDELQTKPKTVKRSK